MDLRWLLLIAVVRGIVGFLLGRRTSPGGRAVHRLQRAVDAKQQELSRHQEEMSRFVSDMQSELEHVSSAYRDLQTRLRTGAEQFGSAVSAASAAIAPVSVSKPVAKLPVQRPRHDDSDSPEWSARLAGSYAGTGGPSLASAAACPLPEHSVLEAPKDYPAMRRSGNFDEHSYA
jgi:uncharacterized membrane-anchored protein YhcB (DUF1043 family)